MLLFPCTQVAQVESMCQQVHCGVGLHHGPWHHEHVLQRLCKCQSSDSSYQRDSGRAHSNRWCFGPIEMESIGHLKGELVKNSTIFGILDAVFLLTHQFLNTLPYPNPFEDFEGGSKILEKVDGAIVFAEVCFFISQATRCLGIEECLSDRACGMHHCLCWKQRFWKDSWS